MSRRGRATVAVAGVVIVGGLVAGALILDDGGPTRDRTPAVGLGAPAEELRVAGVSAQGSELIGLLKKGRTATFHARYQAESSETEGEEVAIDVWRKPPQIRQDTRVSASGRTASTSTFVLADRTVACTRADEAGWQCRTNPEHRPNDPDALIQGVTEELASGPMEVREEVIGGTPARCFTVADGERTREVCATRQGVPARVSSGGARLELVELDTAVSDTVFKLPARPE